MAFMACTGINLFLPFAEQCKLVVSDVKKEFEFYLKVVYHD
jgi:hypothetical protein